MKKGRGISAAKIDDFCKILHCKVENIIVSTDDSTRAVFLRLCRFSFLVKTNKREIEYCALIVCADIRKSVFQAITDVLPRFGIQC